MMSHRVLAALLVVLLASIFSGPVIHVCGAQPAVEEVQLAEPFRAEYAGEDATGEHVVALWQFNKPEPAVDASGNGHMLSLSGAEFVDGGRFGGALQSDRGWPVEDKAHQARVKNDPKLTPAGAFTIEMWLKPADTLREYPEAFLVDKKYVDHNDYQITLSQEVAPDMRNVRATLGFGSESVTWQSDPAHLPPGQWRHIAFTYDAAGTGAFFVDGSPAGSQLKTGFGRITPGRHGLVLGDRIGSYYHGFPGLMDQVRISMGAREFTPVKFELLSSRRVFERMEKTEPLRFGVTNLTNGPLAGARASFGVGSTARQDVELPEIAPGSQHVLEYRFDTALRPDIYKLTASVELPGDEPYSASQSFDIVLAPRQPYRMPVVMWGGASGRQAELRDIGFTHTIGVGCDFRAIWDAGGPTQPGTDARIASSIEDLDAALAAGMRIVSSLSPGSWARSLPEYQRVRRDGAPYTGHEDVCGQFQRIQDFCGQVGESMAKTYGSHPAFDSALLHTEVRGESKPCFHEHDRKAFEAFAGFPIPDEVANMRGVRYDKLPDFPADRVIPDNHPIYVYYKWLWKDGDGWNGLHTRLHRGLKAGSHEQFWTFHDPAVRVASVWNSGGEVDYLSQWTYSYPDPIRIGLATEELLQMASARPDQKVMKMTQIIWYRSQTAPEPGETAKQQAADFDDHDVRPQGTGTVDASGKYRAWWEVEEPGARFITIAPMHLREAFWTKMARPIQGIMYHGIGSLLPGITSGSYRFTHPETRHELKRLVETVVRPLGPTLVQVSDADKDVAFLESFAAEMFAGRGTYGWNGSWAGDMWLICQYASLQPRVVFDETIQQRGLDAYKILVMPDCDVLPQSVVEAVLAFQKRGGIVVGDERLCPAVKPDVLVETHARPKPADEARRLNVEKAIALRKAIDARYERAVDSSTPDVIPYLRRYGTTDYLFAVNDRRQYGDYVGHHELVMEDGLPSDAVLTLRRTGHVYDLAAGRKLDATAENGVLQLKRQFGPCEGHLYMITERPIAAVQVTAAERAKPGETVKVEVAIVDAGGQPIDAVIPVRVDLLDPHGRAAEWSGFYGAKDGKLTITANLAYNDTPGVWRIKAVELASGSESNAYIEVER